MSPIPQQSQPAAPGRAGLDALDEAARRRKVAARLARVAGQVRALKLMVESGADCEQIAVQMSAARRALDRAFYEMLACSLLTQLDANADENTIRASTSELARLLAKYA